MKNLIGVTSSNIATAGIKGIGKRAVSSAALVPSSVLVAKESLHCLRPLSLNSLFNNGRFQNFHYLCCCCTRRSFYLCCTYRVSFYLYIISPKGKTNLIRSSGALARRATPEGPTLAVRDEDLYARDFDDELEARDYEPMELNSRYYDELYPRELYEARLARRDGPAAYAGDGSAGASTRPTGATGSAVSLAAGGASSASASSSGSPPSSGADPSSSFAPDSGSVTSPAASGTAASTSATTGTASDPATTGAASDPAATADSVNPHHSHHGHHGPHGHGRKSHGREGHHGRHRKPKSAATQVDNGQSMESSQNPYSQNPGQGSPATGSSSSGTPVQKRSGTNVSWKRSLAQSLGLGDNFFM